MTIKSIRTGWTGISALAGNPVLGDYESIQTVTVGSGGAADIEFTSIPSTYQHLQIRHFCISNRTTYAVEDIVMRFNGDTAANYSRHGLRGNGATAASVAEANASYILLEYSSGTSVSNFFGVGVTDILDYRDTNKYTTSRSLSGTDTNGLVAGEPGRIYLTSGNWRNTNAITSIKMSPLNGNQWLQHSHFALYGIR